MTVPNKLTKKVRNLLFQLKHINSINYDFQKYEECFTSYLFYKTIEVFEYGLFYQLIFQK